MADVKNISGTTAGQLKTLRAAKDSLLKEWDVSFGINGEVLVNILGFMNDINAEIPLKFYKDRIFTHQKSTDNVQYAEVEISSQDVMDYLPHIDGDPNRKDARSVFKHPDGDYKGILIDVKGTVEEIQSFAQKDDIINIRVDTGYYKRIEFHCPGNVVIWAQLLEPTALLKSLEKLPDTIKKVRNNPDIKKASVIIEPATFTRICNIGGKGKKRDIDERVFIELDKKDGLFISSGDKLKGRIFALKPVDIVSQLGDYGEGGFDSVNIPEGEYEGDIMGDAGDMGLSEVGPDEIDRIGDAGDVGGVGDAGDVGGSDDVGGWDRATGNTGGIEGMVDNTEEEPGFAPSSFVPAEREDKRPDKKRPENRAQVDQVLGMEVDSTQFIYMQQEFLQPFSKLKGLSPISIEVRTDKPLVIIQKPYNGVEALLTIAPRIENEEDK
jgi:hypothetical protein